MRFCKRFVWAWHGAEHKGLQEGGEDVRDAVGILARTPPAIHASSHMRLELKGHVLKHVLLWQNLLRIVGGA